MKIIALLLMIIAVAHIGAQAQPKPYTSHQVIDMGNGQKVEVLSCRNEGPLEECDCIYYTDKRQSGKRMWQNANRLREEERAAKIVKDAAIKQRRQQIADSVATARASGMREMKKEPQEDPAVAAEKRLKESIKNLHRTELQAKPAISLPEIARISDSTAKARKQNIEVGSAQGISQTDSVPIDNVYIPNKPLAKTNVIDSVILKANVKEENVAIKTGAPSIATTTTPLLPPATPNVQTDKEATIDSVTEQTTYVKQYDKLKNSAPESPIQKEKVADNTLNKSTKVTPSFSPKINGGKEIVSDKSAPMSAVKEAKAPMPSTMYSATEKNEKPVETIASQVPSKALNAKANDTAYQNAGAFINVQNKEVGNIDTLILNPESSNKPETVTASKSGETKLAEHLTHATDNVLKTVEVNAMGSWNKAIVVEQEGESLFKVHYADKGAESDEWVTLSQLRNFDSVKGVPAVTTLMKEQKDNLMASCSFAPPVPAVSNAAQFSDKIAERRIYENFFYAKKKSGKGKIGITFLYLQEDTPYANEIVFSTQDLKAKNPIAPTGAIIYPVKTKIKICDETSDVITTSIVDRKYSCYRNKDGVWTCTPDK